MHIKAKDVRNNCAVVVRGRWGCHFFLRCLFIVRHHSLISIYIINEVAIWMFHLYIKISAIIPFVKQPTQEKKSCSGPWVLTYRPWDLFHQTYSKTLNTFDGTDPKVDRLKPKVRNTIFFPVLCMFHYTYRTQNFGSSSLLNLRCRYKSRDKTQRSKLGAPPSFHPRLSAHDNLI